VHTMAPMTAPARAPEEMPDEVVLALLELDPLELFGLFFPLLPPVALGA